MRRVIALKLALVSALALSAGIAAAEGFPVSTSSQYGVIIKITPRTLTGTAWEFDVVFDTHSQDLKDDLLKSATLVAGSVAPSLPVGWQGDPPGGHHRKGVLRFNAVAPFTGSIELRIARPGEPAARSFRWDPR